jgi:hypothetical protein
MKPVGRGLARGGQREGAASVQDRFRIPPGGKGSGGDFGPKKTVPEGPVLILDHGKTVAPAGRNGPDWIMTHAYSAITIRGHDTPATETQETLKRLLGESKARCDREGSPYSNKLDIKVAAIAAMVRQNAQEAVRSARSAGDETTFEAEAVRILCNLVYPWNGPVQLPRESGAYGHQFYLLPGYYSRPGESNGLSEESREDIMQRLTEQRLLYSKHIPRVRSSEELITPNSEDLLTPKRLFETGSGGINSASHTLICATQLSLVMAGVLRQLGYDAYLGDLIPATGSDLFPMRNPPVVVMLTGEGIHTCGMFTVHPQHSSIAVFNDDAVRSMVLARSAELRAWTAIEQILQAWVKELAPDATDASNSTEMMAVLMQRVRTLGVLEKFTTDTRTRSMLEAAMEEVSKMMQHAKEPWEPHAEANPILADALNGALTHFNTFLGTMLMAAENAAHALPPEIVNDEKESNTLSDAARTARALAQNPNLRVIGEMLERVIPQHMRGSRGGR